MRLVGGRPMGLRSDPEPGAAGRRRQIPRLPGQAHERLSSLDLVRHGFEHVDERSPETTLKVSLFENRVDLVLRRA